MNLSARMRLTSAAALILTSLATSCAPPAEVGNGGGTEPPRHHLVLLLERDCRLDAAGDAFVLPDGSRFTPPLPASFELRAMIPELARSDRSEMSEDEAKLASYVLLVPGRGEPSADTMANVLETSPTWPCVREAREAPRPALP